MVSCEMCGHVGDNFHKAIVEGTLLLLCDKCVRFGEVVEMRKPSSEIVDQRLKDAHLRRFAPIEGLASSEEVIVSDYASRVKSARERLGKTQEEIAQMLAEKLSVVQKVESGHMEPPLKLAKKLEQFFRIELVRRVDVSSGEIESSRKVGSFTIGDVIKLK